MMRFRWLLALALVGATAATACGGGGPTAPEVMNTDPSTTPPPGVTLTPLPQPTPRPCHRYPVKVHPCTDD
jgi:hypothetical protein